MLYITLVVFGISYLIRWLWDMNYLDYNDENQPFRYYLAKIIFFLSVDFLPFICIFSLHFRNFRKSSRRRANQNIADDESTKNED